MRAYSEYILSILQHIDSGVEPTPEQISILSKIEALDLNRFDIEDLPESIMLLSGLKSLILRYTKISHLSDTIGHLTNLRELDLWGTHISYLPDAISQLSKLESLNIGYTKVQTLPESFGALVSLKELYANNTPLNETPKSFGNLKNLRVLYLNNTSITAIPDYFKRLQSVRNLSLSRTQIHSIPTWIGKLKNLQNLFIEFLEIDSIPRSLALCGLLFRFSEQTDLDIWDGNNGIWCAGLSLQNQEISIFASGPEAIQRLYQDSKTTIARETRLIVLGDAEVGKTYTIKRIMNGGKRETKSNPYVTNVTEGVEITDLSAFVNRRKIDIHFWDFGGQEILYSMHRCFLTENTAYLVIVKSRDDKKADSQANYWLRTINSLSCNAPVLLMLNCWDESDGRRTLNDGGLETAFPNILRIKRISAKCAATKDYRVFMNELFSFANESKSCQKKLPTAWVNVRSQVRKRAKEEKYLSKSDFYRICEECGVKKEEIPDIRKWFNILGVSFSYQQEGEIEEQANYQLLDPVWLTNAIYAIIAEGAQLSVDGVIRKNAVDNLLSATPKGNPSHRPKPEYTYTSEECTYILRVAEQFKLAYLFPDGRAFFPAFFGNGEPKALDPAKYGDPLTYQLEYEYLPDNVIHQLMVCCMQKHIGMTDCWRCGMRITDEIGKAEAVIRMVGDTILQIEIYSTGEVEPCVMLERLKNLLAEINKTLSLVPQELIKVGDDRFYLCQLLTALKNGITLIPGKDKVYSVKMLLGNIWSENTKHKEFMGVELAELKQD